MSWFNPKPVDIPVVLPRQTPKVKVPSYVGEAGQVLNLLQHHGAGVVARDYSGLGNHGTLIGPNWVDGPFGWALNYVAANSDYITIPHNASLNPTLAISIETLFRRNSSVPTEWVVDRRGGLAGQDVYAIFLSGGSLFAGVSSGGAWTWAIPPAVVVADVFWHIIMTWAAGDNVRAYLNNVVTAGGIFVGPMHSGAYPTLVGARNLAAGIDLFFDGVIALPRIYNRQLTAPEVADHFERTRAIFEI